MQRTKPRRLLNTVDDTTKGLPIVGGVTSPLLKTVGGVTDGLPIVSSLNLFHFPSTTADMIISSELQAVKGKPNNNNLYNNTNTHNLPNTRPWRRTSRKHKRSQC